MSAEPLFQAFPGRVGYPCYTIDLVSPEVPCGAGWLANSLIELGVPAWKQWNTDDRAHWLDVGAYRFRYHLAGSPWSRVLPALVDGREFTFRPDHAVRVHHVWPTAYPRAERTILFVRDPLDALYSAWHRQRRLGALGSNVRFQAFCASRFYHYPISWADYVLLFLRVWRAALRDFGGIVVRFEDYRRDANATLAAALAYLRIEASAMDIVRAVDASDLVRVREAERRMLAEGVVGVPLVRGEATGEYARSEGDALPAEMSSRFEEVSAWDGCSSSDGPTREEPAASTSAPAALLHAIRKAGVPVTGSGWLADAVRSASTDIVPIPGAIVDAEVG